MLERTAPPERRLAGAAAAVCGALLLAGLVIAVIHRVPGYRDENDFAATFAVEARHLLHGQPYTYQFHPLGYSALLALFSLPTGDLFVAAKLIAALATAALAWLSYLAFRQLFDSRIALGATLLLAIRLVPYSYLAATDAAGAALIALAILLLVRHWAATRAWALGLGAAAGLAYLVRTSGIMALLGSVGVLLLLDPLRRPVRARVHAALLVALGFGLALTPMYLYNLATLHQLTGPTMYTQIGPNLDPTVDPSTLTANSAVTGAGAVLHTVLQHPMDVTYRYIRQVTYEYPPRLALEILGFPALLFAGVGAIALLIGADRRRWSYLAVNGVGYLLVGLMIIELRYFLFLFPFAFLLAALGLFPQTAAGEPVWPRRLSWAALAVVALWGSASAMLTVRRDLAEEPDYLLPAARAVRQLRPSDQTWMTGGKPELAYLSGIRYWYPGESTDPRTLDQLLADGRKAGLRFVEYVPEEAAYRTVFAPLGTDSIPAGLQLIYQDRHGVRIFELTR